MKIFPICNTKQRIIKKINERNSKIYRWQVKIADDLSPEMKKIVTPLADVLARFGNKYKNKHGYTLFFSIENEGGLFKNHLKVQSYREIWVPFETNTSGWIPPITSVMRRIPYKGIIIDTNNSVRTIANDIKNMLS